MKKQKHEIPEDIPGQGKRREQYEFAVTMLAGAFAGLFMLVVVLLIVKYINEHLW